MPPKKVVSTKPSVVIVRKKTGTGTGPSTLTPLRPQRSAPVPKAVPPVIAPVEAMPEPIPPPAQPQPSIPPPPSPAPTIVESGPSKREQEKQARRELLEVMRERWPQTFPRDYRQVRPLALGISKDIAAHLPEQPLGRISSAIGIFQHLMGPAYFRAVLQGGSRYDLDGNPRGEVTPEEQERAKRDLTAFFERQKERRKQFAAAKPKARESVQPAET